MALLGPEQRRAVAWAQHEAKESPEQQGEFPTALFDHPTPNSESNPYLGAIWLTGPLREIPGDKGSIGR